jgi:hypothetical protein
MPVLAVWAERRLYFCAGGGTRKARNLADDATCVLAVELEPLGLVVEGAAVKTRDEMTLGRVAEAYAAAYGWEVIVRDGAFHAEGAPTAGPPPYGVYEVLPRLAFGFAIDETMTSTRWQF